MSDNTTIPSKLPRWCVDNKVSHMQAAGQGSRRSNGNCIKRCTACVEHRIADLQAKTAAAQQSRRQGDGSRRRQSGPGGTITAPGRPPSEPAGVLGSAVGFWRAASDRLKDLDLKLSNQVGALGALLDSNPGPLHPAAVGCLQ